MLKNLTLDRREVYEKALVILAGSGVQADDAGRIVDILLDNDEDGYGSHGVMRLMEYVADIETGRVNAKARPIVSRRTPLFIDVEGNGSLGLRTIDAVVTALDDQPATEPLVRFIAIRNAHHLGRLAIIADVFARREYFVLGFANYNGLGQKVAQPGGSTGRVATNPIVFAIPLLNHEPVIMDMTTSVTSEGAVRQKCLNQEPAPAGWLVDSRGQATTDPSLLYTDPMRAFISPLGGTVAGHKGFALSLIAEIFASLVPGAGSVAQPHCTGGQASFLCCSSLRQWA